MLKRATEPGVNLANPKVSACSMGSHQRVPVHRLPLPSHYHLRRLLPRLSSSHSPLRKQRGLRLLLLPLLLLLLFLPAPTVALQTAFDIQFTPNAGPSLAAGWAAGRSAFPTTSVIVKSFGFRRGGRVVVQALLSDAEDESATAATAATSSVGVAYLSLFRSAQWDAWTTAQRASLADGGATFGTTLPSDGLAACWAMRGDTKDTGKGKEGAGSSGGSRSPSRACMRAQNMSAARCIMPSALRQEIRSGTSVNATYDVAAEGLYVLVAMLCVPPAPHRLKGRVEMLNPVRPLSPATYLPSLPGVAAVAAAAAAAGKASGAATLAALRAANLAKSAAATGSVDDDGAATNANAAAAAVASTVEYHHVSIEWEGLTGVFETLIFVYTAFAALWLVFCYRRRGQQRLVRIQYWFLASLACKIVELCVRSLAFRSEATKIDFDVNHAPLDLGALTSALKVR